MIVGSLAILFAIVAAVAHFGYDVPIQNDDAGRPATSAEVIAITALFVSGGLVLTVFGFILRHWSLIVVERQLASNSSPIAHRFAN